MQGDEIDVLSHVLEQSEGKQIYLQVYSTKRKQLRGDSHSNHAAVCAVVVECMLTVPPCFVSLSDA